MTTPESDHVTQLLIAWSNGDQEALDKLTPLVYDELRRLAGGYLRRERRNHTLQTSALVHEAFLRLIDQRVSWQNRAHFFGVAAQAMRRVLVSYARDQRRLKRGGPERQRLELDEALDLAQARDADLVALDDALTTLAQFDLQQSRVVELRYFGGLTIDETAAALGVSPATVEREWRLARAWLRSELTGGDE
ncbi:MAG TPA: sigma-70 family RNA polymerase sigma factor [Blastocatellia bacterium]|nr:sigma-70 family RNA polymerase sigma factor [Blastocatellia bacterium]